MNTIQTLPEKPTVGLQFRPDTTDSIGTVLKVGSGRGGVVVTYSYSHAPEVEHSRPYSELRRLGWPVD